MRISDMSRKIASMVMTSVLAICLGISSMFNGYTASASDVNSTKTNISNCKISLSSNEWYYTGKSRNPYVTVKFKNKTLKQGVDYKLKYTNNVNVGWGTVTVTGYNHFNGVKKLNYKILAIQKPNTPNASAFTNVIKLSWNSVQNSDGYILYRWNTKTNQFIQIYKGRSLSFSDVRRTPDTSYKYRVCAYRTIKNRVYKSYSDSIVKKTLKPTSTMVESYQNEVVKLVNIERSKAKLPALAINEELNSLACDRTLQVQKNVISRPTMKLYLSDHYYNGKNTGDMLNMLNYNWSVNNSYQYSYGENLAFGQESPEEVVKAWMNSEGHRKNILSPNYKRIGIGYKVIDGTVYWVQEFTS